MVTSWVNPSTIEVLCCVRVGKDRVPIAKSQITGDNHGNLFIQIADQLKEELCCCLVYRKETEFIEDQQIEFGKTREEVMIVTLFEPIVRNIWQLFSHILGRAASQKESIARLTAQGKASRLMAGSLVWGLRSASMPPLQGIGGLWHNTSADIVHYDHAGISCRIQGEQLDALWAT
jgi:hypothetical protein